MSADDDLRVRLSPGDQAFVDWYRNWLAWAKTPENERGPEPERPNGRAIDIAARAQTTRCELRGQETDG